MKTSKYIIALCILAAAFSCTKTENSAGLPAPGDQVTIRAILPDQAAVKGAGLETRLSWTWNEGDKITVVGETTEVFKIKEGFGPKQAEFVGKAVKGSSFKIYYPGEEAAASDFSSQVQKGNNSLDHLHYEAVLDDVNDYYEFAFDPSWAEEHGGSLKQIGVLKFVIALPDGVTTANSISLSADEPVFYVGNGEDKTDNLTLAFSDVTVKPEEPVTAWMMTSWNEAEVPAGKALGFSVNASGKVYHQTLSKGSDVVVSTGKVNIINVVDASKWQDDTPRYASGNGTAESPWVIKTPEHMLNIADDLLPGGVRYYKLGADIDMSGVEWVPLNTMSPYDKGIDFDGDGHTISNFSCSATTYPSMFGVLNGYVHNLKFVGANINTTGNTATGIVAGYCGTSGVLAKVDNVHAEGSVTNTGAYSGVGGLFGRILGASADELAMISNCSMKGSVTYTGNKNGIGGFTGLVNNAVLSKCSADVTVSATNCNYVGGMFGYESAKATLTDCWTSGSIQGKERVGGIAGGLIKAESGLYNCYSTASVSALNYIVAGIAAHCNLDAKANNESNDPKNHVEKCIAWNTRIEALIGDDAEHYGSGSVVGYSATKNYLVDCMRKSDLDFHDCSKNTELGYVPVDQENASPETPLVKGAGNYNYGYHGKAAAAGKTLSQVAQDLGWSAEIWDFSGEQPKLK